MSIASFSIKRPITIIMFFAAGVIFGIIALGKMEIDLLPSIQYPEISVITLYRGAAPAEIEQLLTRPIEEAVNGVSGVKRIRSESIEGASLVAATFDWGTDMDLATLRIREKVDLVKGILPQDAEKSMVARFDPNAMPVMNIAVTSPSMDPRTLRNEIDHRIKQHFERVDGVGTTRITGGEIQEIQVNVDLQSLQAYGLSIYDIIENVNMSNYNFPAGTVTRGSKELLIRTIGEFTSLDDIEKVMVKKTESGRHIFVKDIARVSRGSRDKKSASFINGQESVNLGIIKESGKNTVEVCSKLHVLVNELNTKYAGTLQMDICYDSSGYIASAIDNVAISAILGGVIAFLVVLAFLQNLTASLVIIVILPVSIMLTLLAMFLLDVNINLMSLGGMAISTGMLVDGGIVIIESIQKKSDTGLPIEQAANEGTREVTSALLSSMLTSIVVFLPLLLVSGISGQLFGQLAITVSVSLISAFIVSITLIPALIVMAQRNNINTTILFSHFMHHKIQAGLRVIAESINSVMKRLSRQYENHLIKRMDNLRQTTIAAFLIIIFGLVLFLVIDKNLMPHTEPGVFSMRITAPRGTSLSGTRELVLQVDSMLANSTSVKQRIINVGYNPESITEYFGREKNTYTGEILVTMNPDAALSTGDVIKSFNHSLNFPDDIKVEFSADNIELSRLVNIQASSISLDVFGDNMVSLETAADNVINTTGKIEGIRNCIPLIHKGKPEIKIDVDREKLSSLGLHIRDIADFIYASVQGERAGKFYEDDREIDISVRLDEKFRNNVSDLQYIVLKNSEEKIILLNNVAYLTMQEGYSKIIRKNQERCISIIHETTDGYSFSNIIKSIKAKLSSISLPDSVTAALSEEMNEIRDSINSLVMALLLSLLLIYMILASQFESFTVPLLIMCTVPLTFLGTGASLLITGNTINLMSIMGMIMLSGIVVNNAIVLLQYISLYHGQNISLKEAIISACRNRLQPILMTALTTILGLVPLAIGMQKGSEMQSPLAVTVIGGLATATFLTLVIFPVIVFHFHKDRKGP
ncbi:MAG: efflux RND transporter permease subunit [Spirochaetota bacterium]